jgi:hypothetical protein
MPVTSVSKEKPLLSHAEEERYMLGLCNFIPVGDYHCTNVHEKINISDAYTIYAHDQTKKIQIELKNMVSGTYQIIFHHINKKSGSLLDIWEKHSYSQKITKEVLATFKMCHCNAIASKTMCRGNMAPLQLSSRFCCYWYFLQDSFWGVLQTL